jgi:hypothetical protein
MEIPMSALSNPRNTPALGDDPMPKLFSLPVKAATIIYQGALVALGIDGYLVPAAAALPGSVVIGRAEKKGDNSAGASAAIELEVRQGVFRWNNGTTVDVLTVADVGRTAYVVDDNTVGRTDGSGARVPAGVVVKVDASGVFVESHLPALQPNGVDITLIAAADLSASGHVAIKVDTNGQAAVAAAGEPAIGVLQNAPVSGAVAKVRIAGTSYAKAGTGGIVKGSLLASDAAGALVTATKAKTDTSDAGAAADPLIGSNVIGVGLVAALAAADGLVLIQARGAVPTTVA